MILRAVGDADHAERRAGGRDVLAGRQLRVGVHPGEPRRARGLEPRGGRRGRRRRAAAPHSRSRDACAACSGRVSASRSIRAARARRRRTPPTPAAGSTDARTAIRRCFYFPHDDDVSGATVGAACRTAARGARAARRPARRLHANRDRVAPDAHSESEREAGDHAALRRIVRDLGGRDHDGRRLTTSGATRCSRRSTRPSRSRPLAPARSCRLRSSLTLARCRCGGTDAVRDVPAGAGVARKRRAAADGGRRDRSRARRSPNCARAPRRGAPAAIRPGRRRRSRPARAAHHDAGRISPRRNRRSGARATRTPTPGSRASTAACRCRSASR